MNIHQLSVTYVPEQDRILARVNTTAGEEMRLWLTRRLMLGLGPLLGQVMTEHLLQLEAAGTSLEVASDELRTMLADLRKQEFLQTADFDTPYRDSSPTLPLGQEPLLVTQVDASPLPGGRLRLSFGENVPASGGTGLARRFQMDMEPRLMQGLVHLLDQAVTQSGWREPFANAAPAQEAAPSDSVASASRPRYLN
ncbi:MAG: hypothetical protein NVS3B2_12540 [Ramlibacter sp.]